MTNGTTRTLSVTDLPTPSSDRYFEDYRPGEVYEFGYITVTEEEIIEFAERFDPQPIHIDREYAATGPFGGIIASGWHTSAICMRLIADHYLSKVASLASPGIDELRWPSPLRPGDSVRLRTTVIGTRPSASKPDRGVVTTGCELITKDDDRTVLTFRAINLLRRRPEGTA